MARDPFSTLDDPEPEPEPRISTKGNTGIGTAVPEGYLHIKGVGMIRNRPNAWRRFWAWALLGWTWESRD